MKTKTLHILFLLLLSQQIFSQIGIGTTTPNGALDITSTNDGVLIPRIALTATNLATVLTPTVSEMVYNTATSATGANQVTPGFYYWNGTLWVRVVDTDNNTSFNTFSQFAQRPTNLTTADEGKKYLYTLTGNFHLWTGTAWKVLNESVMNVKDYGAIGDGITDDTVALQGIINLINTGFVTKNIFFPYGKYVTTSPMPEIISSNILISGESNTLSEITYYTDFIKIGSPSSPSLTTDIEVRNLKFNCVNTSSKTILFKIQNAANIKFINNVFNNFVNCLTIGGSGTNKSYNATFNNCTGYAQNKPFPAFELLGGAGFYINGCSFFCNVPPPLNNNTNMLTVFGNSLLEISNETWDTVIIDNGLYERWGHITLIKSSTGNNILNIHLSNLIFDFIRFNCISIESGINSIAAVIVINNCYLTSWEGYGIFCGGLGGGTAIDINNSKIFQCGFSAILIENEGYNNINIGNCNIFATGRLDINSPSIEIKSSVKYFTIKNSIINADASQGGAPYSSNVGLKLDLFTNFYLVSSNTIRGLTTPTIIVPDGIVLPKRIYTNNLEY
jgi:Pectate lyase superfamily protein